jgi:putative phosphoesterase
MNSPAVRGNNDTGPWAERLQENELVDCGGVRLLALHDLAELRVDLHALRVRVVVSGHSHKPRIDERDGIIFVNPGSAGPRRFKLPVAVGEVLIEGSSARARVTELAVQPVSRAR